MAPVARCVSSLGQFVQRAKMIKNMPVRNEETHGGMLDVALRQENEGLKKLVTDQVREFHPNEAFDRDTAACWSPRLSVVCAEWVEAGLEYLPVKSKKFPRSFQEVSEPKLVFTEGNESGCPASSRGFAAFPPPHLSWASA